jgi:hypothetical protein
MVRKLVEFPKFWWSTLERIPLGTVPMPLFPYCCRLSSELQFCLPRFQGKMDVTFGKCNCYSFALCLPYGTLASYSTRLIQVSNDAKLNKADGAYKDFRGLYPRHPRGIRRTWACLSPTWWCPTSTTSPSRQPGETTGHS